ncbi:MAG: hypothetical protein ACJATI_001249, partial [Halioglobus sp.]
TAATGVTVTASVGTVTGTSITGVPSGTDVTITASLAGCDTLMVVVPSALCPACGTLVLKVLLEGAYDVATGLMTTFFNDFHILPGQDPMQSSNPGAQFLGEAAPLGQPYNVAPWNYAGTEGNNYGDESINPGVSAYPSTVTDWVLVSLREGGLFAANTVWKCAALLNSDGTVEFPAECDCIDFDDAATYYVVIEHRNHMAVMSNATSSATLQTMMDFTMNDSWKLGIGSPQEVTQKLMMDGVFVMYAANGRQDVTRTDVVSADNTIWLNDNSQIFKYLYGDHNLNADVNSADRTMWLNNVSFFNLINF